MNIRLRKDWELPESVVTPESVYHDSRRRDFLKTLGAAAVLASTHRALGATAGFPSTPHSSHTGLKASAYEHITSYNNFYEFGTDKADPKVYANRGWKTEPWTVEITGLVATPLKLEVNDLIARIGGIEQRI